MLGGGLYLIYLELFEARVVSRKMMVVGVFLALLGGAWLWADYIARCLARRLTSSTPMGPKGQKCPADIP
jgi:hypothetical protein